MAKELDAKDWKILEQLCIDARVSHSSIAKDIGLSKNAVTYKIERLKSKGIISGFFSIVNYQLLGCNSFNLLLRLNASKEKELEVINYLKSHKNTLVVDSFVGEWNFLVEFECRRIDEFFVFLEDFKDKFSDVLDVFEVHPVLVSYRIEQLPVELVKTRPEVREVKNVAEIDDSDLRLLFELNKNCTATLFELASKLGVTYETVSARIKRLRQNGVIVKFTAKINLHALGYDVYLVSFDLRNFSAAKESSLKFFINSQNNIRYAFLSAFRPVLFVYLAVKRSDELNSFLSGIKEKFADVIVNQKYLLSSGQFKYELFPEGLLSK